MRKLLGCLLLALAAMATPANAQNCSAYPYTLTNGNTADASQVMGNFNSIQSCANTNLAHNGANSDITSLSGMTTPLSPAQGGTGNTSGPAAIQGAFQKLVGKWATNSTATWTANQVILANASNAPVLATSYSCTINTAASIGAVTGLDAGSNAAQTFYNVYAIYNGATFSCEYSLSATAPTLVSGYTYFARIGTFYLDGSKNIRGFVQGGKTTHWIVGDNLSALPTMASGSAGSVSAPTWVALALYTAGTSGYAPPAGGTVYLAFVPTTNDVIAAPNNSYGGNTSTTNPPPCVEGGGVTYVCTLGIEGANIYWASNASGAALQSYGYEDNL